MLNFDLVFKITSIVLNILILLCGITVAFLLYRVSKNGMPEEVKWYYIALTSLWAFIVLMNCCS